jgi:hypothetical protein
VRALTIYCGWERTRVAAWLTSLLTQQLLGDDPAAA